MARAYSPAEILAKNYPVLQWRDKWVSGFDRPEVVGVWLIWGHSTNGKTSFIFELIKELATLKKGKIFLNSPEEGSRKVMQNNLIRHGIEEVKRFVLIGDESFEELDKRLETRKSPWVLIYDSIQAGKLTMKQFMKLKAKHEKKHLLIFISWADGKEPKGRVAQEIKALADLKIWVEGFKAISAGRYNAGGTYTIWEEGANKYWGTNAA